jgi:glycosyltransferase involved in cell wall biosynthesis
MTAAESRVPSTASDDVPHGQMVSFVVPAHNEQAAIGRTLQIIHGVAQSIGRPYEIIVVDDASTDATAEISTHRHARVVSVAHRQIAATRNSGARAARGAIIFFIDADTAVNTRVVAAALRAIDRGAAGGGALVRFDGNVPLYARLRGWWLGCFMHGRRVRGRGRL